MFTLTTTETNATQTQTRRPRRTGALLAAAVLGMLAVQSADAQVGQFYDAGQGTVSVWIAQPQAYQVYTNGYLVVRRQTVAEGEWIYFRRVIRVIKGQRFGNTDWYAFHLNTEQRTFVARQRPDPTPNPTPAPRTVDITGKWTGTMVKKTGTRYNDRISFYKDQSGRLRSNQSGAGVIRALGNNRYQWTVGGGTWTATLHSKDAMTILTPIGTFTGRRY